MDIKKLTKKQKLIIAIYFVVFAILIVTTILFLTPLFKFESNALIERKHFDEQISYYDSDYVIETINLMTKGDTESYIKYTTCDFIYCMAYFSCMAMVTVPLLAKKTKWIGIASPMLAFIFDFMENCTIMALLRGDLRGASAVGAFTLLKWIFLLIWLLLFLSLLICKIVKKAKLKKAEANKDVTDDSKVLIENENNEIQ